MSHGRSPHTTRYFIDGKWTIRDKMAFLNQEAADLAIQGLTADGAADRANRPAPLGYTSYQCSHCNAWHVGRVGKRTAWLELTGAERELRHHRICLYWAIYRLRHDRLKLEQVAA